MNDFTPKRLQEASLYLQKKLKACKKREKRTYVVEEKKESYLKHVIHLLFKH